MLKEQVKKLRRSGLTYPEINNRLGKNIAKSTLSFWCRGINPGANYDLRVKKIISVGLKKGRKKSARLKKKRKIIYFSEIYNKNLSIKDKIYKPELAKILLATLYLAEGGEKKGAD